MANNNRLPSAPLSVKQTLFVAAYLKSLDSREAALEAGYGAKNASNQGSLLLRHPAVAAAVAAAIEDRNARTLITADRVVREIARVALVDPRRLLDDEGRLRAPGDLTADEAAAISSIVVIEDPDGSVRHRVKLADKVRALDLLARHVGVVADAPGAAVQVGVSIQVVSGVPRSPTDGE